MSNFWWPLPIEDKLTLSAEAARRLIPSFLPFGLLLLSLVPGLYLLLGLISGSFDFALVFLGCRATFGRTLGSILSPWSYPLFLRIFRDICAHVV
jgi:hypothetical protein